MFFVFYLIGTGDQLLKKCGKKVRNSSHFNFLIEGHEKALLFSGFLELGMNNRTLYQSIIGGIL